MMKQYLRLGFGCLLLCTLIACQSNKLVTSSDNYPLPVPSQGNIISYHAMPSHYVAARDVHVWLPNNYAEQVATGQRFAVLYMHDGQMLFDANITWNQQEWGIDEIAQQLMDTQQTRPFIVVGVHNGGDDLRYPEYMPQQPYQSLKDDFKANLHKQLSLTHPIQSDAYLAFLVQELKPFIDKQFATLADKDNTILGGASMGGLISWYGVAKYPDVFGGCICMSTHFIGGGEVTDTTIFEAFTAYMAKSLPVNGSHRLYFDYGDQTLDQYYPLYHNKLRMFFSQINADPEHVWVKFFPGHDHTEQAWQTRLAIPLKFTLPTHSKVE
jgi:enterochelin esterase-like enzyme